LSHQVRTFAKYLYALKKVGKAKSEMNDIDCLRLKRNYAWWLFTGTKLTFEGFRVLVKAQYCTTFMIIWHAAPGVVIQRKVWVSWKSWQNTDARRKMQSCTYNVRR
jgi:hypothetical protein